MSKVALQLTYVWPEHHMIWFQVMFKYKCLKVFLYAMMKMEVMEMHVSSIDEYNGWEVRKGSDSHFGWK